MIFLVLSDGVIAGQMLGEKALGAANMLMPIFMVVSFFTWLLAVGTSIVYSDAMARMQRERAANLAGQGLVASVLLGLALGVTVFAVKGLYVGFMASDAETTGHALGYLNWYPLVVFLEAIDLLLLYLVYTDGGAVSCTVSYCAQVVVNIVLSYGLCAGKWGLPRLGMGGIALGTVAAYLSGVAMLLPRFFRRGRCGVRFTPKFLPNEFLRSLQLSFGDASSGLFQALLLFVATKYIILLWGPDTLPVATVAFFVVRLSLFFNGVGIALQPIETVYHGEGNTAGINGLVRFAASISVLEGLFLTVVVFVAPDLIASAVGIDSPEHVSEASHAARWTCVGLTGYALASFKVATAIEDSTSAYSAVITARQKKIDQLGDVQKALTEVQYQIDKEDNLLQQDMVSMQSFVSKRDNAFSTASKIIRKTNNAASATIANIGG